MRTNIHNKKWNDDIIPWLTTYVGVEFKIATAEKSAELEKHNLNHIGLEYIWCGDGWRILKGYDYYEESGWCYDVYIDDPKFFTFFVMSWL